METGVSAVRPSPRRTPQAREEYRKSLYKSSPSPWRITYEKRCRERLKESRSKFLERFRAISSESTASDPPLSTTSILPDHGSSVVTEEGTTVPRDPLQGISNEVIRSSVEAVMRKEWESMREEHSSLPQLSPSDRPRRKGWATVGASFDGEDPMDEGFNSEADEVEYVLSIMDQLTQELIDEERAILCQYSQQLYEENQRFSESMLLSAAADSMTHHSELVCPICQKNYLQQNLHIIFCACGLRLDTAQDCVTLDFVRQQLQDCTSLHGSSCDGKPVFSVETTLGTQNIIMNCTHCDFMYIIV